MTKGEYASLMGFHTFSPIFDPNAPLDADFVKTVKCIMEIVTEPKHGRWIESQIPEEKYVCSNCGGACWYYDYQGEVAKSRFCPNCGARMMDEVEE